MRVGVFGGTFDPVHNGHLAAAAAAAQAAGLSEVIFVPVGDPGHRQPPIASASDRLAMLRLAVSSSADVGESVTFAVSDIDAERDGQTFSVNTLTDIHAARPDDELFFILGADAYARFDSWRNPQGIRDLATLVVVERVLPAGVGDGAADSHDAVISASLHGYDISASDIRVKCAAGESIAHLVPSEVAEYIAQHGVYAS